MKYTIAAATALAIAACAPPATSVSGDIFIDDQTEDGVYVIVQEMDSHEADVYTLHDTVFECEYILVVTTYGVELTPRINDGVHVCGY